MPTTPILKHTLSTAKENAIAVLRSGGVVAFPTDTVYGIGCLVSDSIAIEKLYVIKERELSKAIPLLIGSIDQISEIVEENSLEAQKLESSFWPGALTLVLPKKSHLPKRLSVFSTIGVRNPDHSWLNQLMINAGPLAVTSANLSGKTPAISVEQIVEQLDGRIDLIIDGGICSGGIPSTVVDCSERKIQILREGAIPAEDIFKALGE